MKPTTEKLLSKAERAISAAQALLDLPDSEAAVARAYYAMFYAVDETITGAQAQELLGQTREFVREARCYLEGGA